MVRRIDIEAATVGNWTAVDALMQEQMQQGTFEDTVAVFRWTGETPSYGLGTWLDADNFDATGARAEGARVGRHFGFGGSIGMFDPKLPVIVMWFDEGDVSGDRTLLNRFDINGKATAAALTELGLDAEYRPVGDIEITQDGVRYKITATAANTVPVAGYVKAVSSLIWGPPSSELTELMEEFQHMPPEKFEDKETDSMTARIRPISGYLDDIDLEVSMDEVIDSVVKRNVTAFLGEDASIREGEWSVEEQAFINTMVPFFESDVWYQRVSTSRLCRRQPQDREVGVASYKSRKLVKASVFLGDDRTIDDILISGDFYAQYVPTATKWGVIRELENELIGLDPQDEETLLEAISAVYERPDVEILGVEPEDIVSPIVRAAENTQPVESYLEEYA
jgi:hypothetical protein